MTIRFVMLKLPKGYERKTEKKTRGHGSVLDGTDEEQGNRTNLCDGPLDW